MKSLTSLKWKTTTCSPYQQSLIAFLLVDDKIINRHQLHCVGRFLPNVSVPILYTPTITNADAITTVRMSQQIVFSNIITYFCEKVSRCFLSSNNFLFLAASCGLTRDVNVVITDRLKTLPALCCYRTYSA